MRPPALRTEPLETEGGFSMGNFMGWGAQGTRESLWNPSKITSTGEWDLAGAPETTHALLTKEDKTAPHTKKN